jgi:hypothetical protein
MGLNDSPRADLVIELLRKDRRRLVLPEKHGSLVLKGSSSEYLLEWTEIYRLAYSCKLTKCFVNELFSHAKGVTRCQTILNRYTTEVNLKLVAQLQIASECAWVWKFLQLLRNRDAASVALTRSSGPRWMSATIAPILCPPAILAITVTDPDAESIWLFFRSRQCPDLRSCGLTPLAAGFERR